MKLKLGERLPTRWQLALVIFVWGLPVMAPGMIFISTGDPAFNTAAPTGALAASGWQWVGNFNGYAATAIGSHYFVSAHHIGGNVGDNFIYNGVSYPTAARYDDTASDLRIWEIVGTFPTWAPLYRQNDEVGKNLVVFGAGLGRGAPVAVDGVLKGWLWGGNGQTLRWGTNKIDSVVSGGAYWGQLLHVPFDQSGGVNEAQLAVGDSSGPIFVDTASGWSLAGVAADVDAYFNFGTTDGGAFDAAIFDARGLYYGSPGAWTLIGGVSPVPSAFYATQISVRAAWIDGVVGPDPGALDTPILGNWGACVLAGSLCCVGAFYLSPRPRAPASP